ncbi:MAG: MATE family efflux transporter [Acidimicrobiales bacterium]
MAWRWRAIDRDIARLAVPALGALVAEPLYILADTAVVGHLGTQELGGLALAGQLLLTVHAVSIFLAYGTTAAVSRLLGAGDRGRAADEAVQSIWLAVGIGILGAVLLGIFAEPLLELLGGEGETLDHAYTYLTISLPGIPAMLISLACVGYLRGLQDTVRPLIVAVTTALGNLALELVLIFGFDLGVGASAFSTVVAQWAGAALYLHWVRQNVRAYGVGLSPRLQAIRSQLVVAGDLFLRTVALRASFTVSVAAAARIGEAELAAHEIATQLFFLIALALDAVAIAGQALVGRFLGADDAEGARRVGRRMIKWGLATGLAAGAIVLVLRPWLPGVFSNDPEVIELASMVFIQLALLAPLAGIVFTLDGILIGAGDMRFLAWAMAGAAALFVPLALAVPALGLGLGWLWACYWVLMTARAIPLLARFVNERWLVTGASFSRAESN